MTIAAGHVLVAEDNPALLGVIALTLRKSGLEVTTAETGLEAWRELEANEIDLVLTDFNMPEMTGGELCEKMRAHPRHRTTPVVILTALSEDFQREHDLNSLDVASIIPKPFSPREVTAQVMELLRQERSRETIAAGNDVPHSRNSD